MNSESLYPIRVVSTKTEVNSSTLRAWERRYGLIKPERTPKGHRLYSDKSIEKIYRIKELLKDGHSFVSIKQLLNSNTKSNQFNGEELEDLWEDKIIRVKTAVEDFSFNRIDALYNEATSLYPMDIVLEKLVEPLLKHHINNKGSAESGFFNKWLQIRLTSRFHHDNSNSIDAKKIIFLSSAKDETLLMLICNMIIAQGYQALFFASLLPFDDLARVAQRSAAKAVIMLTNDEFIKGNPKINDIFNQLKIPIFVFSSDQQKIYTEIEKSKAIMLGGNKAIGVNLFKKHMHNIYHE